MFATFGAIVFEVTTAPENLESTRRWNYTEHHVVESLSLLQWVGDGLETMAIGMMFHASFTNPGLQVAALRLAASAHLAYPLVFGNGDHRGYFVVTSMRVTSRHMASDGSPIMITVRAELKQWPLEASINAGVSLSLPFTPIGIVAAAAGAPTGPIASPSGLASTPASPNTVYSQPALAAPGVSPLLSQPSQASPISATFFTDILPEIIVRSGD
jgi:phage protein U